MRKGLGLVAAAGIGALMVGGALRASGIDDRLFTVVDRVNHSAFDMAERIFHRDEGAAHRVEYRVRNRASASEAEVRAVRASSVSQDAEFRWTGTVARGDYVEIKGLSGTIHAEPASGSQVEVVATKTSNRSDLDDVRIEVIEHSDGVTVCAVYPGTRAEDCSSDGRSKNQKVDVQVEFEVRVPAGVGFVGSTVNGDVEAVGLEDVDINTVNGDVSLLATGETRANTVNGSIEAEISAGALSGPIRLNTVNGSIALDLPDGADANLVASWVNGSFSSDLPFQMEGRRDRRATGTFGVGGELIEVGTVNGSIEIN